MNFASYIEKSGLAVPDKTCVVQDDLRLTFGQMEERANRLAWALTAMGIKPGTGWLSFKPTVTNFVK
jgi:non-ribosomal peptide synthetase component E (peptide arylation enzyme)